MAKLSPYDPNDKVGKYAFGKALPAYGGEFLTVKPTKNLARALYSGSSYVSTSSKLEDQVTDSDN